MKKLLTSLAFLMFALFISAQSSVGKYQKFEYTFDASSATALTASDWTLINSKNPFDKDQIVLKAVFYDPNGTPKPVEGFYYGQYTIAASGQTHPAWPAVPGEKAIKNNVENWKVRFAPEKIGSYTYVIEFYLPVENQTLSVRSSSFTCIPIKGVKGFVRLNNGFDFSYDNGDIFHPIGLNTPATPEYNDNGPKVNFYDGQFKRIKENGGNYARIWINLPTSLKIQGLVNDWGGCEYYLDVLNLRDAYIFDKIFEKAELHNIKLQVVLFTSNSLDDQWGYWDEYDIYNANFDHPSCDDIEEQNNAGPCNSSSDFYTHPEALKYQSDFVRYVIDRYGYSTSIMAWELFNEDNYTANQNTLAELVNWNSTTKTIINTQDVYERAVTTSFWGWPLDPNAPWDKWTAVNSIMDYIQVHIYTDNLARSNEYGNKLMYQIINSFKSSNPGKPVMIGEAGALANFGNYGFQNYKTHDPHGFSVRTDIFSSLFYADLGAAEYWNIDQFIDKADPAMGASTVFEAFEGLKQIAAKIPSKKNCTFHMTEPGLYNLMGEFIRSNMWAHYMQDGNNKIYGWCQDKQFTFCRGSLIISTNNTTGVVTTKPYATNPIAANIPSRTTSQYYTVVLKNVAPKTQYKVQWYNAQTGSYVSTEYVTADCQLILEVPAALRNAKYGDAVFIAEPAQLNNINGWENVWANGGSGNIGGWGPIASSDRFFAGDFDNNGSEELLCVQTSGPNKWMTTLNYVNDEWQWGWSNGGASHPLQIYLPYFQYGGDFLIGDFDGDGGDDILVNCIGATTLFKYQNNNFVQVWTASGNHAVNPYKDGLSVGDIDGDGKAELIGHIQNSWTTTFKFVPVGGGNYDFVWNTSDAGSGPMVPYGKMHTGNFDGIGGDEAISFSSWATIFPYNGSSFQWGWTNGGSTSFGGWTYPFASNNAVLIGDLDNDAKDELLLIETGTTGDWAATMDFSLDGYGGFSGGNWNWNWSANPLNGNVPYINNWLITDHPGESSKYMLIQAEAGHPDYLLAFRTNAYCSTSKYKVGMYRSLNGTNKSASINSQETIDNLSEEETTWSVYPNPFQEEVSVELYNTNQVSTVQMYTTLGTLLTEINVPAANEKQKLSIDMSVYKNGMYIIVWNTAEGKKTKHITKM